MTVAAGVSRKLRPVHRTRISHDVVIQLTELILKGDWKPGERLPPERQLAEELEINRTSLREALRKLENLGLVKVQPGDGIYVMDPDERSGIDLLSFLMENAMSLDADMLANLAALRYFVLEAIIRVAARNHDIPKLESLLNEARNYPGDLEPWEADFHFYKNLARCSGNRIFGLLMNSLRSTIVQLSQLFASIEGDPDTARTMYTKVAEALLEGDGDKAFKIFEAQAREDDKLLNSFTDL